MSALSGFGTDPVFPDGCDAAEEARKQSIDPCLAEQVGCQPGVSKPTRMNGYAVQVCMSDSKPRFGSTAERVKRDFV